VALQLVVDIGKIGNRGRRTPDGGRTLARQLLFDWTSSQSAISGQLFPAASAALRYS
jgi:hypothetical protein